MVMPRSAWSTRSRYGTPHAPPSRSDMARVLVTDLETPAQRLGGEIMTVFGREELSWQDRLMQHADPSALLQPLGDAQWYDSVLVNGWPVYPVAGAGTRAWLIIGRNISYGYPLRAVYLPDTDDLVYRDEAEPNLVDAAVDAVRNRPF